MGRILGGEVLLRFCQHFWVLKAEHDIASYTLISVFMALTVISALSNMNL